MMNVLEVQDNLKNFSEQQLVKEMQQPSGSTPQFLVLSELNRRKRVKGDFEARQAQNQPTVAEEAVASAGVPQSGMMGMSEAMAPQSAVSEGVGTSAPMKMASGGLAQFGNEIREGMGQEIDPYLDGVQQEAESKFNVDLNNNEMSSIYSGHRGPGSPGTMDQIRPAIAYPHQTNQRIPFNPGMGGKGMARPEPAVISNRAYPSSLLSFENDRGGSGMNPFGARRNYAEGGVIRAANGLPEETSYGDDFLEYIKGMPSAMYDTGNAALDFISPRLKGMEPKPEDTGFESMMKGAGRNLNLISDIPSGIYSGAKSITDPISNFFTQPGNLKEQEKEEEEDAKNIDQALNDAKSKAPTESKAKEKDETKPLTLEEELIKRQAGLDKDRNFDKYMALAQAGLGILASDKPTLAGAIGEGGMKGLDAFNAANKRYEEGLNDILNARVKLKSAKKSGLTQKDAISAINGIDANIARLEKGSETYQYNDAKMKEIKNKIAQLEFQKESLMPSAGYGRLSRNVSDSANIKS